MRKCDVTKKLKKLGSHKTVGKVARFLRRNVRGPLSYDDSVKIAIGHFQASGETGARILHGSKLTYLMKATAA